MSTEEATGRVVSVFGDIVSVAVDEENLHEMGIRGKFLRIETKKGRSLIGIVANLNLIDELYRQSGGRLPLVKGYRDIALSRNEIIVSILGTITENGVDRKIDAIPSPGDEVFPIESDELQKIFSSGDIRIGTLNTDPTVSVKLDLNELATKHLAILAMTGSGKSNALAVLLTRMLANYEYPRILLIDTHSEYVGLAKEDSPVYDKTVVYAPTGKFKDILISSGIKTAELEIPYWLLTMEEWYSLIGLDPRATRQRRQLRAALRDLKREFGSDNAHLDDPIYFPLDSLIDELSGRRDTDEILMKIEDSLENEEFQFIFNPANSLKLMKGEGLEAVFNYITKPIVDAGLKIIAMGGLSSDIQNAVVSMLLRSTFRFAIEAKLLGRPLPTIIALEEAHIYAPSYYATAKQIVERIAKEGRKFGIGLIVVSQRPRELSETVLAQCGTLIALRTVNPSDQRHIERSMEDVTSMIISSLPGLGKGESVISGPAVALPCLVKVDLFDNVAEELGKRIGLGGKDINFKEEWQKEISKEDVSRIFSELYSGVEQKKHAFEESSKSSLELFFGEE